MTLQPYRYLCNPTGTPATPQITPTTPTDNPAALQIRLQLPPILPHAALMSQTMQDFMHKHLLDLQHWQT